MIVDDDSHIETECQNITNQTIVGTKVGVINSLIKIVGGGVLIDAVTMMTPNGQDFRNIDNYTLYKLMQAAVEHASRPDVDDMCKMMMMFFLMEFDLINQ